MAVPKSWDQVDDSISAALRQIVEREEKVENALKQDIPTSELLSKLKELHSKPDLTDPCRVDAFAPGPHPAGAESINTLKTKAAELHTANQSKLAEEKARIQRLCSEGEALDPTAEELRLVQLREALTEIKSWTQKLEEMDPSSDVAKSRGEVLKSAHSEDEVKCMSKEQMSAAFQKISRDRVVGRREACRDVAEKILAASKRPCKIEEIHRSGAVRDGFQEDAGKLEQSEQEIQQILERLKKHLSEKQSQHNECVNVRAKAAKEKGSAHSRLGRALKELKEASVEYSDATTTLAALDASMTILETDIKDLEKKVTESEAATTDAFSTCKTSKEFARTAKGDVEQATSDSAAAVVKHGQTPCAAAFENVLTAQTLLRKAILEVQSELRDLRDKKDGIQRQLSETKELWNQGQTGPNVQEKFAELKDELEATQKDIESDELIEKQLRERITAADDQKESFLSIVADGFMVDEGSIQQCADGHVHSSYGRVRITSAAPAEQTLQAADANPMAIQQQVPNLEAIIAQQVMEAVRKMESQKNAEMFALQQENQRLKASVAGSQANANESAKGG